MERVNVGGRLVIRYDRGDRVMVMTEDGQRPGTVVYLTDGDGRDTFGYGVRLDGDRYTRKASHTQIVKQADNGGMGRVSHLEAF